MGLSEEDKKELDVINIKLNNLSLKYGCRFELNELETSIFDDGERNYFAYKLKAYIPEKEIY